MANTFTANVNKAMHNEDEKAGLYDIDFDALPQSSKDYLIAYGLNKSLNDCVAAKDKQGKTAHEAVLERIAKLRAGTIGQREKSNAPAQSKLEKRVWKLAANAVKAALDAKKIALKSLKEGVFERNVEAFIEAKRQQLTEKAQEQLAAEAKAKETAAGDVELDIT